MTVLLSYSAHDSLYVCHPTNSATETSNILRVSRAAPPTTPAAAVRRPRRAPAPDPFGLIVESQSDRRDRHVIRAPVNRTRRVPRVGRIHRIKWIVLRHGTLPHYRLDFHHSHGGPGRVSAVWFLTEFPEAMIVPGTLAQQESESFE